MYNKTDFLGLQTFLHEKFAVWASSGSSVEEIRNKLKNIVCESLGRFVPHTILRKKIRTPNITTRQLNDENQRSEKHVTEEN